VFTASSKEIKDALHILRVKFKRESFTKENRMDEDQQLPKMSEHLPEVFTSVKINDEKNT